MAEVSALRDLEELRGYTQSNPLSVSQQEAIEELSNRQKAASAAGTVSPFESSFNPFNPNFRATAQNAISNMLGGSQISSNPNYLQGRIANSLSGLVDFIPAVGDAVGVGDTITSYRQGDIPSTVINAAATGIGVLPLVGGPASKAVKAGGKKFRSALRGIDPSLSKYEIDFDFPITHESSDNNFGGEILELTNGPFDGVFGMGGLKGNSLGAGGSHHTYLPRMGKVAEEGSRSLDYDMSVEFINKEFPSANQREKKLLYEAIAEDVDLFSLADGQDNPLSGISGMPNDIGEADWFLQNYRGKMALDQDFDAISMSDENGVSYLVPFGSKSKYAGKNIESYDELKSLRSIYDDPSSSVALGETPSVRDGGSQLPTLTIGDTPLAGAPSLPRIPERGLVRIGPNPEVAAAAEDYSQRSGIPSQPIVRYASVDEPRATQIAREYDLMRHDPQNPEVKRSYDAMIEETLGQYDSLLARGIEPYFINDVDPYKNSPYEALIDLEQNKRLGIFPTRSGFGSNVDFDPRDNPLLGESGYNIGGQPALNNDIFRFVHDAMGHGRGGVGFRARGEENAYQSHAGMYSPLARRALASETRGQNSFLNYGPNAEANRTASVEDTIFADQKTGLMPRHSSESGLIINDDRRERFYDALRRGETGLEGAITDDGKLQIIHRSNQPIERVDPEMYGQGLSRRSAERNRAGNPDFIKRAYYGITTSKNPYRREMGIGRIQNEVLIEPELLYDARKDPDKLWVPNDPTASEKRIADSNYTGYFVDDPKIGKVAAIFDPYDSTKTFMIPLVAGATALSALREVEEEPI